MAPKDDVEARPACHPRACAIQGTKPSPNSCNIILHWYSGSRKLTHLTDCLTRNGYNEAKCQNVVKALYECCEVFYERYGDDSNSPSCPKASLLRLKMKQLREEGK
ncbi:hypothetical protein G7046_g9521 [Stylonectria norvegica]|nr:hypothetical protein G7046_g9521 [Stylonectria norvegica]